MTNPVEVYFGQSAVEQFDADREAETLNAIRAERLKISKEQSEQSAKLLHDVLRSLFMGYYE